MVEYRFVNYRFALESANIDDIDDDTTEQLDARILRFLNNPLIQFGNLFSGIPDSFWDPVVVSLSETQICSLKRKLKKQNCTICSDDVYNYKVLPCCKNDLCLDCTSSWFSKSVKCPYCNQDLRDFI
jgi:hypothetical protein